MFRRLLTFILFTPIFCMAQAWQDYRATSLDAVFAEWDGITQLSGPGVSILRPQKIKFIATHRSNPEPCNTGVLEAVATTLGATALLKQMSVHHCFAISGESGRHAIAFVQDILVPGLKADAKLDGKIEVYAHMLAYNVDPDRSRNMPLLIVGRFEPQ